MKVLWIVNMVVPDAAKELGIRTSFSGSWMVDPLRMLSKDETLEMATMTYGQVSQRTIITVDRVKHYIFPGGGKQLLLSSKKTDENCRFVLEDFQPDLIHIYGTEYSMGHSVLKLQPKQPVVLTVQGILSYICKEYRGGLPGHIYHTLVTPKQLLRLKMPLLTELLFKKNAKREQEVIRQARYITGRTDHDKAFVLSVNPRATYFRLNYNLREEFYQAEKWQYDTCEKYTIFTGAATYPLKGLHTLLDAVAMVKKRYPQVRLLVPGNNVSYQKSNGYERYLHRKIRALGLEKNVEFIGRKSAQEMAECLKNANVYVLPSAYDTDSLSLCEAQYLGTPCVASMRGGSGELVQDQFSGLCYHYTDYALLAEKICRLFGSESLCRMLSANEIQQAAQRHDRIRNVAQQRQLYTDILDQYKK